MRRFQNRNYELEDLYQIGSIGFLKAVQKFDVTKETQLSTYATYLIIGEIKRFLRDNGPIKMSRSLKETAIKVKELQRKQLQEKGIEYSLEELSRVLEMEKEEIVVALDASIKIESFDQTMGEKGTTEKDEYETIINKIVLEKVLYQLEEQERKVILFRYNREMTQIQIARLMGVSQVQISRIEKRAIEKMRTIWNK